MRAAHEQLEVYRRKVEVVDEYERQVRLLREEVSYLTSEKSLLQERWPQAFTKHIQTYVHAYTHAHVHLTIQSDPYLY